MRINFVLLLALALMGSTPGAVLARTEAKDSNVGQAPLIKFAPPWTSPFQVDAKRPHQLVNTEGEHLLILNKTAWAFFGCEDPAGYLDRAREQGVNVIRVALEGRPYWDDLKIEMWPWGGTREEPKWSEFNESYWAEVEKRVRLAGDKGIGIDLVLYFTLHPDAKDIGAQRPYWDHILRRLGKYANILTWELANEYTRNESFQDAAGRFFKENDPHRRPVCSSDGTTDNALWPNKPWMDLAINHSCTSSSAHHDLRDWYLTVARNTRAHGKPAWCNESGRERRHQNDDGVHRRKQGWLWYAAGSFWTWHSWDGCEGINDRQYRAPGEEFLSPMARTFRSLPFWRMNPADTTAVVNDQALVQSTLATAERDCVLLYCCTRQTGKAMSNATATVRLPDGAYRVSILKPANGSVLETRSHLVKGPGQEGRVALPFFTDDLALRIERQQSAAQQSAAQLPMQAWFPKAPPLAAPKGEVIHVTTVEELFAAVARVRPGGTVMIADGHYWLPRCLWLRTDNITLRGESGHRERVIFDGARSQHGELVALQGCSGVTLADLTVQNVQHNGIKINSDSNVHQVTIYNCILHNIWQRGVKGVKVPLDKRQQMSPRDCRVQYCLFYNDRPKRLEDDPADPAQNFDGNYVGGIDVMYARAWTIADNVFIGIQGRTRGARGAVFLWHETVDCVVERNIIIDCDTGIALGNSHKPAEVPVHATRCVVRNNFISRAPENGIVADFTRDCRIVHNTVHDPRNRLGRLIRLVHDNEGLVVANNLLSGPPLRNESTSVMTVRDNPAADLTRHFMEPDKGNLHLKSPLPDALEPVPAFESVDEDLDRQPRSARTSPGADEPRP